MNIAQLETTLREKQAAIKTLLEQQMREANAAVVTPATATTPAVTGRLRTTEEKAAVEALMEEARGIKARIDGAQNDAALQQQIEQLTSNLTRSNVTTNRERIVLASPGTQLMQSEFGDWLRKSQGRRGSNWTSPSAEIAAAEFWAATLTSDPASGGTLIVPDYRPGIVEYLFRQLVVADLLAQGTTSSNLISFMRELAPTNAAATVAEGAAKPESALVFEAATAPVRKVATWLPVTDEMLDDVPAMRSYIDSRLRMFVMLAEDDQLLNGNGTPPNLLGLRNQTGMQADLARGTDTNADAIFKQMTLIAVNAFLQVDGITMNPANWQTVQLAKDANGQYYGNGPFAAAPTPRLWGVPVAVTPAMTAGVALPGAYRTGAQMFRNGGLRVDASNSHQDFFTKNLTAIRAEERIALAVYRPGGFGEVTGLN